MFIYGRHSCLSSSFCDFSLELVDVQSPGGVSKAPVCVSSVFFVVKQMKQKNKDRIFHFFVFSIETDIMYNGRFNIEHRCPY